MCTAGLPRSGKKVWKMNFFPGKGKSGNFNFSQGNFEKVVSQGKVREFENFQKSLLLKGF